MHVWVHPTCHMIAHHAGLTPTHKYLFMQRRQTHTSNMWCDLLPVRWRESGHRQCQQPQWHQQQHACEWTGRAPRFVTGVHPAHAGGACRMAGVLFAAACHDMTFRWCTVPTTYIAPQPKLHQSPSLPQAHAHISGAQTAPSSVKAHHAPPLHAVHAHVHATPTFSQACVQ